MLGTMPVTERIAALRAFNRFYTRRIGVLNESLLDTRFSLPESRVLWELAHQSGQSASVLACTLDIDPGYLSRLLATLRGRGLVKSQRSAADGRQTLLSLSAAGKRAYAPLDRRSHEQMAAVLAPLTEGEQQDLLAATARIGALLGEGDAAPVRLRGLRPGDIGWMVARHGVLYAAEYGWDQRFEALVARIGADYVDRHDSTKECASFAERAGQPLGCVFLVQARHEETGRVEPGVAQLRLLLVEPAARGLGIGKQLVDECTRFARASGYRWIRLWTNSVLLAARGIYAKAGYRLVASEAHQSFGHHLVGETWELQL